MLLVKAMITKYYNPCLNIHSTHDTMLQLMKNNSKLFMKTHTIK